MLCFSATFACTRLALTAFDPLVIAFVRGAGAGTAALACILAVRGKVPPRHQLVRLSGAALGMVIGFPCLLSFALQIVPATHASVVGAILPLMTAFFGVLIGHERASQGFWISAIVGTIWITLFCAYRSGFRAIEGADLLLVLAFLACSYGYAEGGILAKELGGWWVICWVLTLALPIELVALGSYVFIHGFWIKTPTIWAWAGLLYVTAISQYIGFYFYYKGLALGGVAKMSQVQLFLPFCAIVVSHFVLGETIDAATIGGAILVTATVFGGRVSLARRTQSGERTDHAGGTVEGDRGNGYGKLSGSQTRKLNSRNPGRPGDNRSLEEAKQKGGILRNSAPPAA